MIPIRDEIKTKRIPFVNYTLIAINIIVFLIMVLNPAKIDSIVMGNALIPTDVTQGFKIGVLKNFITAMFMHAGWMHLISNMLYLWIFGDNIEDRLGHVGYLLFYLAAGIFASGLHIFFNPTSNVPSLGASGAIAGVLGAYLIFYPQSKVYTFIPFGYFMRLRPLPAIVVLGLWFVMQIFSGVGSMMAQGRGGGVAYWAHIGGFVFGLLIGFLFNKRIKEPVPAPPHWN
ncbi:MAG: rhomboid family intramembrane serine protease [Chloroflexi bacterium]|jgi:membrane associated rhomboid family serine protease|nr:rhomboid family intramembrane serine protease [Chloroflexota bacterium]